MDNAQFQRIVRRASLAPSVHNTQPARWRLTDWTVELWCDTSKTLTIGDPDGRDAALSCGAALETTVLAMQAEGIGVEVTNLWEQSADDPFHPVAQIDMRGAGQADPLATHLEQRFTHRGAFGAKLLRDWARGDMVLVTDAATKCWLATLNDQISLTVMRNDTFRAELLDWMRLSPSHPQNGVDGMNAEALRMPPMIAKIAGKALGSWWPILDKLKLTPFLTSEAKATNTAAAIACFHRPTDESPIETGRAYLRLWLEATSRGMAGWPMAALADDPQSNAEICTRLGLSDNRRLIQVLRFGVPDAPAPSRARYDLDKLIL